MMKFQLDSDVLYKYCDPRGIDILQSLRLKVTPPNQFNDPFEFMPRVETEISAAVVRRRACCRGYGTFLGTGNLTRQGDMFM